MGNVLQIAVQIISNFPNIPQNTLQSSYWFIDRWRRRPLQNIRRCSHHLCFCFKQARHSATLLTAVLYCTVAPYFMYTSNMWINHPNTVRQYTLLHTTFHVRPLQQSAKNPQVTAQFVTATCCNAKRSDSSGVSGSNTGREIQSCSPAQHSQISGLYRKVPGPSLLHGTNNPAWGYLVIVLTHSKKISWKHLKWSRNGSLYILWIQNLLIILSTIRC
jgi:hypothetical protein